MTKNEATIKVANDRTKKSNRFFGAALILLWVAVYLAIHFHLIKTL